MGSTYQLSFPLALVGLCPWGAPVDQGVGETAWIFLYFLFFHHPSVTIAHAKQPPSIVTSHGALSTLPPPPSLSS